MLKQGAHKILKRRMEQRKILEWSMHGARGKLKREHGVQKLKIKKEKYIDKREKVTEN